MHEVEVREPGRPPRRLAIETSVLFGRECDGQQVLDPQVSRNHLRLSASNGSLQVTDLGSTNGTFVNGTRVHGTAPLAAGDVVRLGDVQILILLPPRTDDVVADADGQPEPAGPPISDRRGPAPRPALEDLAARTSPEAVIRFKPGTPGARAAGSVAAGVRRARRRLAGLGSEPWGLQPQICLVDPFPDPDDPTQLVTSGTIVDATTAEIWMVVTPESPPEPPERSLALLFGAGLPAAADLAVLLEGYGLFVAEAPDPRLQLRPLDLPPLSAARDELRAAMGLSFVHYLVDHSGREDFLRFLASAQPGRVDAAAVKIYGAGLATLEQGWRKKVAEDPNSVKTGQFVRLSMRYMRPYIGREAEMFLYALMGLGFTIVFPFVTRRLFDKSLPSGHFSEVLSLLGVLAVALAVSLLSGLRASYLSAYVSGSVVRQLREEMFAKLQRLSAGWFSLHRQGDVLSRMFSDVSLLESGLSETLRGGILELLSLVVSAAVLLVLNAELAVIVLIAVPLVAVVYRSMSTGARKRSRAVRDQTGALVNVAAENYNAQPVVKAFALEAYERTRFRQASDLLFRRQVRMTLFSGLFGLGVDLITTALRIVVLGFGAWLIIHHHLTLGGLVAFLGIMGEVISPVSRLTSLGQQIQSATGALVRINEVLDAVPEVDDVPGAFSIPPLTTGIRLANVTFSYTSERDTLTDIDLHIEAGTRVALVGPTGAGKSSVLQLIMRSYDPDQGAVLFDGQDIRQATVASLRGQLGVVFQETFVYDATIRENIAVGKAGATDEEIEAAARSAELHDFIASLPRGYHTLVGERGGRLSGGQRQRLAIARALLRQPAVLVLDEATSALDPRTERLIAQTLKNVGQGRTTIAATHRLTSIVDYDRIVVLVEGKVVEQGTHDELLQFRGVYAGLWDERTADPSAGAPGPSIDIGVALARIPIFRDLTGDDLQVVAGRLGATDLVAGQWLAEGGGLLYIVLRGRARVLAPDLSGQLTPVAELQPGDAFGVAALLGPPSGLVLEAVDLVKAALLDEQSIAAIAARYPAVEAALAGASSDPGPAHGQRLTRMLIGISLQGPAVPAAVPDPVPPPSQI